ncbi:MAG: pyridoxine 5'-phosphate synthase [Pseudomonadota bacterium]
MSRSIDLGVNVDHVATVRQARGTRYPDPVYAALVAEHAGADSITVHLREDRRHIQDADVMALGSRLQTRMNLEMAATEEMIDFALSVGPSDCCLVPEKRSELTTEGGLDVAASVDELESHCRRLAGEGIRVSLFVDPERRQLDAALQVQASVVELHTGAYADATSERERAVELARIVDASAYANSLGLRVHAGHGLSYHNVEPVAAIDEIRELNIGHAIIAEAMFEGLAVAVTRMKQLMLGARRA